MPVPCFLCGMLLTNYMKDMVICSLCKETIGPCCVGHFEYDKKSICKQCTSNKPKKLSDFGSNTESLLNLMDYLQECYEIDGKKPNCKNKAILIKTKKESPNIYALWKMRRVIGSKKIEEQLFFSPDFFK